MKIFLANYDPIGIGGGWSFARNFYKSMGDAISNYDEADIYFITSASMVSREDVEKAKQDGKKIVLRNDNIIRNSRNRSTGMTRMKDFSDWADLVIFQSEFAEELLNPYLHTENFKIILNGVDQSIFNTEGRVDDVDRYLYAKHSSDETKNWEMARVAYQKIHEKEPKAILNIAGRFEVSEEHNFDFYNGEHYMYYGYITDPGSMAQIYRKSDYFIYTYFNDACSQTAIEALSCGVDIYDPWGMAETGGTPEILDKFKHFGPNYFSMERMAEQYKRAMEKL